MVFYLRDRDSLQIQRLRPLADREVELAEKNSGTESVSSELGALSCIHSWRRCHTTHVQQIRGAFAANTDTHTHTDSLVWRKGCPFRDKGPPFRIAHHCCTAAKCCRFLK